MAEPRYTVGLVQINNSFSGQNYLPYSVALLEAYTKACAARPERYGFLPPLYKRIRIDAAVESLFAADIVGFSTYVWNARISLEIARRLKARKPETMIVFGGPQVPDRPESFLRGHDFIDVLVHKEGERTFLKLLETFPDNEWVDIPGITYISPDRRLVRNPDGPRIGELDEVPSPFLEGVFESLMQANPDETWIGLWETNRGCPFQCTFCDWGSATAAKVNKFELERLKREVRWFSSRKIEYVFCCDANFGILKRDVEIAEYVAEVKRKTGYPQALSVQNTKNATERAYLTQKILADAGLNKGVALSMQSLDHTSLEYIKRQNISLDSYLELQRRFTRDKVETYSDLILALPGETYESFTEGVNVLIENGQHDRIQFNNLSILPNAEMAEARYREKYGLVTVESEIINIHGHREELDDDVREVQELVIATDSMPRRDWCKTRAFAWITALLHFDKLLQIPLIVTHELSKISYQDMIEAFMGVEAGDYPMIAEIRDFFLQEAESIQNGGPEYVYAEEWLGIYWPADEYVFIRLTAEKKLGAFYDEALGLLERLVESRAVQIPFQAVVDAVVVNHALVKQPFVGDDVVAQTDYEVLAFYQGTLQGDQKPLRKNSTVIHIDRSTERWDDFQEWCREVVWYGNKKGAYLYGNRVLEKQLAGHY